jgi:hypothetical protein
LRSDRTVHFEDRAHVVQKNLAEKEKTNHISMIGLYLCGTIYSPTHFGRGTDRRKTVP